MTNVKIDAQPSEGTQALVQAELDQIVNDALANGKLKLSPTGVTMDRRTFFNTLQDAIARGIAIAQNASEPQE